MIGNLLLKDIRANRVILLILWSFLLPYAGFVFYLTKNEPAVFPYACVQFIAAIIYSVFGFEKRTFNEILICSLPVKRSTVVIARYLSSYAHIAVCIVIFLLLYFLLNSLLPSPYENINLMIIIKIVFASFFALSLLISYSFPIIFKFGFLLGGIISLTIAVFFFFIVPLNSGFNGMRTILNIIRNPEIAVLYSLLSTGIIVITGISIVMSIKLYSKIEL